ncbi:MAG: gfo/Idh/MocA family oxidoreductase [Phycisphaerales bacterium]|nr:MAG: gfo/Idh/MocA family oxidoreductase [Phycisphaerales bacterium]
MAEPIGVGVVGLGFMGRTHLNAYNSAAESGLPCRVVAVCSSDPAQLDPTHEAGGNIDSGAEGPLFDPEQVACYTDYGAMLADDRVGLVSVCTPTPTHVDLAIRALKAGKHVLVEKPVAVSLREVQRLEKAASEAGTLCVPAMCVRAWPAWAWLKDRVEDGSLGELRSLSIRRLGTRPGWSSFYADPGASGGALVDLHIHDTDFVFWLLGMPQSVSSAGTIDHVTTQYRYEGVPAHVVAEGAWDHHEGFPFVMRYTAIFDYATADCKLGRDPELCLYRKGEAEPIELEPITGWDGQIRRFIGAIAEGGDPPATMGEAAAVMRVIEAEQQSLAEGGAVRV